MSILKSENRSAAHPFAFKLAKIISIVIHPIPMSLLGIGLLSYLDLGNVEQAVVFAALYAAIVLAPLYLMLLINVKKGHYTNLDVSIRKQRRGLYILGIVCLIIYILVVYVFLDPSRFFYVLCLTALVVALAFALITKLWTKISVHCGTLSILSSLVAYFSQNLAILFVLLTLTISWSRSMLSRHTLLQIILSWMVPPLIATSIFFLA